MKICMRHVGLTGVIEDDAVIFTACSVFIEWVKIVLKNKNKINTCIFFSKKTNMGKNKIWHKQHKEKDVHVPQRNSTTIDTKNQSLDERRGGKQVA